MAGGSQNAQRCRTQLDAAKAKLTTMQRQLKAAQARLAALNAAAARQAAINAAARSSNSAVQRRARRHRRRRRVDDGN